MKKFLYLALAIGLTSMNACKKGELNTRKELISGGASGVDTLTGTISVNTIVTRKTWLQGIVYVDAGVTLTIDPGVTIVGSPGSVVPDVVNLSNNKGILVIGQNAKIIANGTAASPVVWTSSRSAGSRAPGDWGGLVILGKAPIHTASGTNTNYYAPLESPPFFTDTRFLYGGTDATSNSGSVTYNRFEFGGGAIWPAANVSAVALCGVGTATVFHHNEASNSADDGFSFYGGSVSAHHLISYGIKDDDLSFDEGYLGKMQFIIAYRTDRCDNSGAHTIESSNDQNSTNNTPHTNPFITNATLIGPVDLTNGTGETGNYYDGEIVIRRNSRMTLLNSLIVSQAQPYSLVTTPTTRTLVSATLTLSDNIVIANNIFQENSVHPIVTSSIEGSPVVPTDDAVVLGKLMGLDNTSLTGLADFHLDGALSPLTGSPALSGGLDLSAYGFFGTTQRGAVITSDLWTSGLAGAWISTSTN